MSELYGTRDIQSIEEAANSKELMGMFIIDDIIRGNKKQINNFCESEEAKVLVEKTVLTKPTLMRLSKQDDQKRRVKLIAYKLAKEANDPEWKKLKKYTALRKQSIRKIMNKYGKRAEKIAKIAQKNYIKTAKSVKATPAEAKAQSAR
jgi:hypothetical protein